MTTVDRAEYVVALRGALVRRIEGTRRVRRWVSVGAGSAVLIAAGGAAAASGWLGLPGQDVVTPMAGVVGVSGTGDRQIDLGPAPAGATDIDVSFRCLDPGTFVYPDGALETCGAVDLGPASTYTMKIPSATGVMTFRATPGARWSATLQYVGREPSAFATNAHGDTYGIEDSEGRTPDLVAVMATNGLQGYAYADTLNPQPEFDSPDEALAWQQEHAGETWKVPVYESDGTTVIGQFEIGG